MPEPSYILIPDYKFFKPDHWLFQDIEDMQKLLIMLPDPPSKSTVCNYHRPIPNQKWERTQLPKSFHRFRGMGKDDIYNKLTKDEIAFIVGEYKKIINGHWFYNDGELLWISGTNYMYLNWWKIDTEKGFPDFRLCDTEFFWHWWKVCEDKDCAGLIDLERRRAGKSARAGVIAYAETFTKKNVLTGIQSKTDDDARKFFQKTIVKPWKRLPFFLQPEFDSSNNPRDELRFYSPTYRGEEARKEISTGVALESNIEVRASVNIAFDGEKLWRSIDDEAGKASESDIVDRWMNVKKHCIQVDNRIFGKALVTSSVGEMTKGGGANFKRLWEYSDPSKKVDGRTASWLEQHYIPAYDGYIIDEYGRTKKEEALEALKKRFEGLKGKPAELSAEKRQFPRNLKEAFRAAIGECRFNIAIIDEIVEKYTFENKEITYGNFKWKDGKRDSEVIFVPSDRHSARWIVSYLFEDQKMSNKKYLNGGIWFPGNFNWGTTGADPFRVDEVVSNKKSMGTGVVFRGHDINIDQEHKEISEWKTNCFVATYRNRPLRDEYCEDMLMMCVYYGIPMFPEMNITVVSDYFKSRGYNGFLLHQKDVNYRISKVPGANTNPKSIGIMFSEMDAWIDNFGLYTKHPEIMEAARDADPGRLQPSDLFVAACYALLGERSKKISYTQVSQKATSQPMFQTFSI
jgi:hypothetical protein